MCKFVVLSFVNFTKCQRGGRVPGHTRVPLLLVIGIVALGILSIYFYFLIVPLIFLWMAMHFVFYI